MNSPIPGFKPKTTPDRYPTRETWPRPGVYGHHKGRPVQLMEIYFQHRALFKTGPYSTMAADLQDFVVWPFQNEPMPWTAGLPNAPEALL
jgi:hypothetical protein